MYKYVFVWDKSFLGTVIFPPAVWICKSECFHSRV